MKYLIIGVGAAGITAAKTIREQQPEADITMISTDNRVHSRCMLHHYLSLERTEETLSFVPQDFFQTQNIQWISGMRVTTITPKEHSITLENGKQLVFDKLLIATGANSFIPP
ncbi:MAG: FAD/NAD(P)-binding oxidoreductase, partial [Lachnospiraceae bacterium]